MTNIIIKRYNLEHVISHNKELYNVNNLWVSRGATKPEDYRLVNDNVNTSKWIDSFHKDKYSYIDFNKNDIEWMFKAIKIGAQTGTFSRLHVEELEWTYEKYNERFLTAMAKIGLSEVFIRSETVSLKYGQYGAGPYSDFKKVLMSMASSMWGHEVFQDDEPYYRIYLFPWLAMEKDKEFRIFVHNNSITAISQQHIYSVNDWLNTLEDSEIVSVVGEKILEFFRTNIRSKLEWLHDYVMDLSILETGEPYFIEVNPFGGDYTSGSALFHWSIDHDTLYDDKSIEFRYTKVR